jgi:hypothetical protein
MLWLLDLGKTQPACPDWIELRTEREVAATV